MDNKKFKGLENDGWDKMKLLLDKEMPQRKRRRVPFVYWFSGVAASILLVSSIRSIAYFDSIDEKEVFEYSSISDKRQLKQNENSGSHKQVATQYEAEYQPNVVHNKLSEDNKNGQNNSLLKNTFIKKNNFWSKPTISNRSLDFANIFRETTFHETKGLSSVESNNVKSETVSMSQLPEIHKDNAVNISDLYSIADQDLIKDNDGVDLSSIKVNDLNLFSSVEQKSDESNTKMIDIANKNFDVSIDNNNDSLYESPLFESKNTLNPLQSDHNLFIEAGWSSSIGKTWRNTFNLGLRHDLIKRSQWQWQFGTSVFFTPFNLEYTIDNPSNDITQKVNLDANRYTIKDMTGINFGSFIQVHFTRENPLYFHFHAGASIVRLNQEDLINDRSMNTSIASPDFTQITSALTSDLKVDRMIFSGSLGVGYSFERFRLELNYKLNQGILRNSGIKNEDLRWLGSAGINCLYQF